MSSYLWNYGTSHQQLLVEERADLARQGEAGVRVERRLRGVLQRAPGRERRAKRGEAFAVLEQARARGRMRADVAVGHPAEEAAVDEPGHDGIGRLEGRGQARQDVMAVDGQPCGRRQAVIHDLSRDAGLVI